MSANTIKIGDRVKMSEDLKKGMIANGSGDHIKEFGDCEGYVEPNEDGVCDFEVRWEPSGLRYGYDSKDLVKVVDMNKPANVVLNEEILECEAQCGTPFYENILKAMDNFGNQEAERRERLAYRKGLREMAEHKDKEIKAMEAKFKQLETEIDQRIAHLKDVDADFCKDRWDMTKPEQERNIYREMSNQVTATRQELEMLKKNFKLQENFEEGEKKEVKADHTVRDIAAESYKVDMAAFAEGCGQPFNALAWHVYKRAFDIASYRLPQKREEMSRIVKERLQYHFGKVGGGWLIPEDMPFMKEFLNEVQKLCGVADFRKDRKPDAEFIISSAVNWKGKFICGRRHADCYNIADALLDTADSFLERERKHQGFMTSAGRFVDRAEAFKIAKANGQIVHKMFDDQETGSLTSEDLFGVEEE